ncbi:phage tail family protein [Exiguobacterium sp. s102]|uniref:phage tail family protein n=1 Tax=Exiguobacterium sp. s102 TaxID=2751212 RepID=UPI001BECFD70|nr:phage tail family protein [Exiguobacterium sp. s102]
MFLTIETLDGQTYKLDDDKYRIHTIDFKVSSPEYNHQSDNIEGRDGQIDLGSSYTKRKLTAELYLKASSMASYALYRDQVFKLFKSKKAFYITESRTPWKRWLVKVTNSFELDQTRIFGVFTVEMETSGLPYVESRATTQQPLVWMDNGWFWGAGISWGDSMDQYNVVNDTEFVIPNYGDVVVDPRQMGLVIRFNGASSNLTLTNLTTGETFAYYGTTGASDTLVLDGVRVLKNDISVVRQTNYGLLTMAIGNNDFLVEGALGNFTLSFEFRFYYL